VPTSRLIINREADKHTHIRTNRILIFVLLLWRCCASFTTLVQLVE